MGYKLLLQILWLGLGFETAALSKGKQVGLIYSKSVIFVGKARKLSHRNQTLQLGDLLCFRSR
jgi:hypothetical protein